MTADKEELKKRFVAEVISCRGFKTVACANLRIDPRTFQRWQAEDGEFRRAVADAVELARAFRDDRAEQELFKKVEGGDTTAVIFYAKTRLKNRGYTERPQPAAAPQAAPEPAATPAALPRTAEGADVKKKIAAKKAYIVKLLKRQGKYSAELSMQAGVVAQLLVRTELLAEEIFSSGHSAVNVELSREGNERESINPKEKLYLDFLGQSQKALRALGMNTDSRARPADGDNLGEFLAEFREG